MGAVPFAFSVHNFISSVGADAGFAAIVGLAILVLLYFAHARETANLRDEATALSERLAQAEATVAQLSRAQSASAAPAPAAVQVTDQRRPAAQPAAAVPFAPAGMAAPALAAATRAIPMAHALPQQAVAGQAAARQPAPPQPMPVQPSATPPPESQRAPGPRPAIATASAAAAVVSATAGGTSELKAVESNSPAGVPRPATAAGANGSGHGQARSAPVAAGLTAAAATSQPRQAPPRPLPPLGDTGRRRSSTARRVALALGALLIVAAAVTLVAITATGTSSHDSASVRTTNAPSAAAGASGFAPSSVTIAVLNGTSTNELAHRVAAKLAASGYKEGRIATAANQTETNTVVAYLPGAKNRRAALHVATALKLSAAAVRPIDQPAQQVACPPPGACTANVVVTVGADLATL